MFVSFSFVSYTIYFSFFVSFSSSFVLYTRPLSLRSFAGCATTGSMKGYCFTACRTGRGRCQSKAGSEWQNSNSWHLIETAYMVSDRSSAKLIQCKSNDDCSDATSAYDLNLNTDYTQCWAGYHPRNTDHPFPRGKCFGKFSLGTHS